MNRTTSVLIGSLILASVLAGCTVKPAARMDTYLGPSNKADQAASTEALKTLRGQIDVGVLLINDTSAPDTAPALSDNAKRFLSDQVPKQLDGKVPLQVVKVLPSTNMTQNADPQHFAQLGRNEGVQYVLLAIFSSAESEVPLMLPLDGAPEQGGGGRVGVSGFETDNFALAELALIETKTGRVLVRSEGRAWSKLNRLYVPVQSNAYPVIHRSLRIAPIYPPEKDAKDILRSIAGDEALEQAVMHLQEVWPRS